MAKVKTPGVEIPITADISKATNNLEKIKNQSQKSLGPIGKMAAAVKKNFLSIAGSVVAAGFAIKGNSLVLSPKPNTNATDALKLYYVKTLANITSASSIYGIPTEYHEIIVWGVVRRAMFQQQSTSESYAIANDEYRRLLAEMRKGLENRQIQRPRSVRRRKHRWR